MKKTVLLLLLAVISFFSQNVMAVDETTDADYSGYRMVISPKGSFELQGDGSGTHFEAKDVYVKDCYNLYLRNMEAGTSYYSRTAGVVVDPDNLSCKLYFHDSLQTGPDAYPVFLQLEDAHYDIAVDFDGEEAEVTFTKLRDHEYPFLTYNIDILAPDNLRVPYTSADANHTRFRKIPIDGDTEFYFIGSTPVKKFGWDAENTPALTPENPTTTVYAPSTSPVKIEGLHGYYDITLTYNEDFTSAEVSIEESTVNAEIADYDGALYIVNTMGQQVCTMECTEPGKYRWAGPELKGSFTITGIKEMAADGVSEEYFTLGALRYPGSTTIYPDTQFELQEKGYPINFDQPLYFLADAEVAVDLRNLTMEVKGEMTLPEFDVATTRLVTNDFGETYDPEMTEEGLVYREVPMGNISRIYLANKLSMSGSVYFGWPLDGGNATLTSANNATTLTPATETNRFSQVEVSFGDVTCDIYVAFNADQTEATLRIEPSTSGVGAIEADIDLTEPLEVYDLSGVKVGTATEGLPKGVYILKQGAKRVKIAL